MFQTPQNLGYQYMMLPTQARQQFQQQGGGTPPAMQPNPMANPQMGQQQNLIANQQAQQTQQQNNPLTQAQTAMSAINGLNKPPTSSPPQNPLLGSAMNPAANNQGAIDSYNQLQNGDNAAQIQKMFSSGLPTQPDWLQRNLPGLSGMFGGAGSWFS